MPKCSDCPSFVSADETQVTFKQNVGAPVCHKFGYILGKPGLSELAEERLHETFANGCAEFGNPRDSKSKFPQTLVGDADYDVMRGGAVFDPSSETPLATCASCEIFVPDEVIKRELGYAMPMCAANGRLLFRHRLAEEPRECVYQRQGENRKTVDPWFKFDARYEEAFSWDSTHIDVGGGFTFDLNAEFVEPTTRETDKPVTPAQDAFGVRAWVQCGVKLTGEKIYYPIFKPERFTPEEQALIPRTGCDEHPELYVDYMGLVYDVFFEWMDQDSTPIFWGPPGVGKTEFLRHLAWLMQVPFLRVSITASSEIEDLEGKPALVANVDGMGSHTEWADGRITKGWSRICVMCLDEPNAAPDEVWQFMRPMLDNSKQLVIDRNMGEARTRNAFCFIGLCANPAWDIKNTGVRELAAADTDRLSHVFIDVPPRSIEEKIMRQACKTIDDYEPSQEIVDKVMAIAENLRAQIEEGSLDISWGIRPQIAVLRKTAGYNLEKAYRRALVDRLDPGTQAQVMAVVRDYVV